MNREQADKVVADVERSLTEGGEVPASAVAAIGGVVRLLATAVMDLRRIAEAVETLASAPAGVSPQDIARGIQIAKHGDGPPMPGY